MIAGSPFTARVDVSGVPFHDAPQMMNNPGFVLTKLPSHNEEGERYLLSF